MKNIYTYILLFAAAIGLAAGCAKEVTSGPNEANKRFIKAWMHVYNQTKGTYIEPSGLGVYILDETPGDGAEVTENGYAIVEYIKTDLDGNISDYTDALTAKQLGTYARVNYYGPKVWLTKDGTIQAGLQDALVGMKAGGRKKVVVPSWLMTYSTYGSAAEYLKHSSDYSNTIYDVTVKFFTDSIDVWQQDSIETEAFRPMQRSFQKTQAYISTTPASCSTALYSTQHPKELQKSRAYSTRPGHMNR